MATSKKTAAKTAEQEAEANEQTAEAPRRTVPSPDVRQCLDPNAQLFGAVAVRASDNRWGVMHPANGGHWATDSDVSDWNVMTDAGAPDDGE